MKFEHLAHPGPLPLTCVLVLGQYIEYSSILSINSIHKKAHKLYVVTPNNRLQISETGTAHVQDAMYAPNNYNMHSIIAILGKNDIIIDI